jgi:hypothetical protein
MPVSYPVIRRIFAWAPLLVLTWMYVIITPARALAATELWINEVMFNPPGTNNLPNQFVELRGTPNLPLTNTYFVAVEGDTNGNPGSVENVFDLSAYRIGGNGFLVLLQNSNRYAVNPAATVLVNTNGPGFGSGSGGSIEHRGKNGQVMLQSASTTFFLVNANTAPSPGDDIDEDDDGAPDGDVYATWAVLDSVGVLDNNGWGDFAYGQLNFRRSEAPGSTAVATGTIVPLGFTPGYVARIKNSTNTGPADWLAADELGGVAPRWTLLAGQTYPASSKGMLNHVGAPNFGGAKLAGLVVRLLGGSEFVEGSAPGRYTIGLSLPCRKGLSVQLAAPPGIEVSIDNGRTYTSTATLKLSATRARKILVRQVNDDAVGPLQRTIDIIHTITASGDPLRYPVATTIAPPATFVVRDDDTVVLSELKVNPPGPEDAPFEFAEVRGTPNARLDDVKLLAVMGDVELDPGAVSLVDLSGSRLGPDGTLLIAATGHPYLPSAGTPLVFAPQLNVPGGGFHNGTVTFLLVHTTNAIAEAADLDQGDNGKLEKLPMDTSILDSVGWKGGSPGGVNYTPAIINFANGVPDAASRFKNDNRPSVAVAWFGGNLDGTNGESIIYDERRVTPIFPHGTVLSPGTENNSAPQISALPPASGVIGDRTVPPLTFTIGDAESPVNSLVLTVQGSNDVVLPSGSLVLSGSGSNRTLVVQPAGVGYASITITVSDGQASSRRVIPYAASLDWRGGGRFHSGASDGSTAYAIDSRWMLVGDDENQRIRLYSRTNSGPPVALFDMNPFLNLQDFYDNGSPKEVDIEGSTHVGNRIYWLGSHSHAGDAEIRTNRARLFGTDIAGSGTNVTLTYAGHYEFLKFDLLNWDAHGEHGKPNFHYRLAESSAEGVDPKDTNGVGFNMEGLAMAPNTTNTAYLGFRAPLVPPTNRVHALVIPVTNFATLASSQSPPGSARFGAPIEVNLGGRGIRSFESIGNNYLIVAGPPGVASGIPPSDFKLFTWSGNPADQPQQLSAEFPGLNVEGIVALPPLPWTSNSLVQLMSDNGVELYYNDDIQAKHLPIREFKKFRTDWIRLGHVVTPQPFIRAAVKIEDAAMSITWHSFAGITYRVQSKGALSDSEWIDLAGDVTATSATSVKWVEPSPTRKFFRVIALE